MALISILFGIWESAWRRLFGSDCKHKILGNRFLQHLANAALVALLLQIYDKSITITVLVVLVFQGLYWSRSHGCCFDIGHGTPDESRYNDLWYWKYIKLLVPSSQLYGPMCDWVVLTVRYTLPSLLVSLLMFSIAPAFMGVVLSSVYLFCWVAYDWGLTSHPTEWAELIAGFTTGLLLFL